MKQKILRIQLITLFVLTLINLFYFYLRDWLPDNIFHISGDTASIGFFSYYLSSLLSVVGYFVGPWVMGAFIIFSVFYSLLFSKRDNPMDLSYVFLILAFVCGFSIVALPYSVGEGLKYLAEDIFTPAALVLLSLSFFSLFIFGSFEGSREKMITFFRNLNQSLMNWHRKYQYKKAGKERVRALAHDTNKVELTKKMSSFLRGSQETLKNKLATLPKKEKILKEKKVKHNVVAEMLGPVTSIEESIITETNTKLQLLDVAPIAIEEEFEENLKEEAKQVAQKKPSIFTRKKGKEFFKSGDLIDCITRGSANITQHNPDVDYFELIIDSLEEKFRDFKISAKIINILKGPVVDTFEVELGPGVKVSKIQGIQKDLTLALRGAPVRIVSNMKGKSTMGLEVPRNPREIIYLDELLRSEDFKNTKCHLPIAMGKDAYGEACVVDLAKMPHMLVAGSTGAGKSVFINTLLVSLLIKLPPEKMKLILIDPKQLELALYHKLPHLILPVTSEPSMTATYLLWACQEMERRYTILSEFGVRNINAFNEKVAKASDEDIMKIHSHYEGHEGVGYELPYLVIIIDEFADLILSGEGKNIENSICRLAAKARAAGIHLVLATQRPSVDVITGLVKANFPTRVSFRVTSMIDSRTILNSGGAEMLLGMGDMLYKHGIDMRRLHSGYVDEEEIEQLVNKLSDIPLEFSAGAMSFVENGPEDDGYGGVKITIPGNAGSTLAAKDVKYDEAVQVAMEHRKVSASFLQRKLGIGYNRAARIIELMEERKIVGPQQGSKPRKVLIGGEI
jgi:DNA segregation ATPase FtsK/SpoIIIE, S-DNA-T family